MTQPSTEILTIYTVLTDQPAVEPNWIDEIMEYIRAGSLPEDKGKAPNVKRIVSSYEIINDQLYKRSFGGQLLKCLLPHQVEQAMEEVHRGLCSAHQEANTLSQNILL